MFTKVRNALQGKKSYIVAVFLVVYAIVGVYTKQLDSQAAIILVLNGLGLGSLRALVSHMQ